MPKLAANLSWLFTEVPLVERFALAAQNGFRAVEILFPYELAAADVAAELAAHDLELVLINVPPGDRAAGEFGFAARPGDETRFAHGLDEALAYAGVCGCPRVHVLSGRRVADVPLAAHDDTLAANLVRSAPRAAEMGITLLIEPLNERDNPRYVLTSSDQAIAVLDRVNAPNVALQLDLYHTFVTEGHVPERVDALRGRYAHVQIASCPDRHEPDRGELDARAVLAQIDAQGYAGWIGLEYAPRTTTIAGLDWTKPYLGSLS